MKLKRIRPQRVQIAIVHFLQSHLKIISLLIIIGLLSISLSKINHFLKNSKITPQYIATFFQDPIDNLKHSNQRTNFLLLGIKGAGQTGVQDLADTIILVSFHHPSKQITTMSIPRDLWVDSLKTKINAVYHYGQQHDPPSGLSLIQASIQETLGVPVHYTSVINFNGFVEMIDLVNGVEVNVEKGFTDNLFPIPGRENLYPISDRYETITFQQGKQTMNGETALKFVRSRHSEGEEGTDFARSRRQQLIIKALRHKLLSADTLLNKTLRSGLIDIIQRNLTTNITTNDYPSLARLILSSKDKPISSINLSAQATDNDIAILENPPRHLYQNQWVLIAKDGNWEALKQYIQNNLAR